MDAETTQLLDVVKDCGALISFSGRVRGDEGIEELFIEHYPGMTERSLARIVDKACRLWPLAGVTLIHRVGTLAVGEPIVLVLTACAHRRDAYESNAFVMDGLKNEAVFWKRERRRLAAHTEHRWIESTAEDRAAGRAWNSGMKSWSSGGASLADADRVSQE